MKSRKPLVSTIALLLLLPLGTAGQEDARLDPLLLEISSLLLEAQPSSQEEIDALELAIAGFGSDILSPCFTVLSSGRLVRVVDEGQLEELPLTHDQDEIVLGALMRLRPSVVSDFLHWMGPEIDTEGEWYTAMRLLRHVGSKRDLALLVHLTNPAPETRRLELSRREPFANALRESLTRDPLAGRELAEAYQAAHPALVAPIVRTVGRMDSGAGMRLLARLFGIVAEADPLILVELARMGESVPHPLGEDILNATRRYLHESDPELLMLSADACARLEDVEGATRLIDLLDHPIRAVGNEAYEALKVMTGLDYGRSPKRWEEWYDKNLEWWRWEAPELLASLARGAPAEVSHALLELSKWRFYRHEIAVEVAAVLRREERDLVVLACAVLGHLGSWQGVEALVRCLDEPDPEIRRAAVRALERITGRALGGDLEAWRALAEEFSWAGS